MDDIIQPSKTDGSSNLDSQTNKTNKLSNTALEAALKEEEAKEKVADTASSQPAKPPKQPRKSFKEWFKLKHSNLSKKQKALVIFGCLILIVGAGVGIYYLHKHLTSVPTSHTTTIIKPKTPVKKPTTVPSNLTGLPVDPSMNNRPVTGVMIENSPDARPQSGLYDAGVVYEAVAEGGITRFLALYQEAQSTSLGPIRSARPYYLDFLLPFDAPLAHVGGAPQALSDIKTLGVKDLDQFYNGGYYTRITTRYAPHNVYTSIAKLNELETSKGYTSSKFTGFARKPDAPSKTPTAGSVDIAISGTFYNVHYDYDPTADAYKRSEGGQPHMDLLTGKQIEPKVVVALVMSRGIASDGEHTNYGTTGSGQMFVFQDGTVTTGTWSKISRQAQFTFTDASGKPLKFNVGQTWITIADSGATTYKP